MSDCVPSKIISRNVTILYGSLYGLLLLIVSIYSFYFLKKFDDKFRTSGFFRRLKMWVKDVWKRKSCYLPLVAHLFDQITDIAVAIQFYQLGTQKSDNGNWTACNGLNMWYLFILTILSIVTYRVISCYLIFITTKSIKRVIGQILDLELFQTLYINYLCNKTEPCDPQRWLTALEAALESSPQTLIQLIFLIKTGTYNESWLILISLLSSFWSIISKLVSDDKILVSVKAKSGSKYTIIYFIIVIISLCCCGIYVIIFFIPFIIFTILTMITIKSSFYKIVKIIRNLLAFIYDKSIKDCPYELRVMWRILDVSSHVLLMVFIWIAIGGTALTIKVACESLIFLFICIKNNKWELLFGLVALVISRATYDLDIMSKRIFAYRTICNFMFIIMITIWLYIDFECPRCTKYNQRKELISTQIIFTFFIYIWIAIILNCVCFMILITEHTVQIETTDENGNKHRQNAGIQIFQHGKSNSRQMNEMINTNNIDGILEIQLYGNNYGIYNQEQKATLLMLAMKENKVAVVSYLLNNMESKLFMTTDIHGANILDWYCDGHKIKDMKHIQKRQWMTNILQKIYEMEPSLLNKTGKNAIICGCICQEKEMVNINKLDLSLRASMFLYYCQQGNGEMIEKLLILYPNLIQEQNILDFYIKNKNTLSNKAILYINKLDSLLMSSEKKIPLFLCVAYHGNIEVMEELAVIDPKCINSKDINGSGLFYYLPYNLEQINCFNFYEKFPKCVDFDGRSPFFVECSRGNGEIIYKLLKLYPNLISRKDKINRNILNYYYKNKNVLTDDCIIYINKLNPNIISNTLNMSLFLCVAHHGDIQSMKKLIEFDKNVLQHTDYKGRDVLYHLHDRYDIIQLLSNEYGMQTKLPSKMQETMEKKEMDRNIEIQIEYTVQTEVKHTMKDDEVKEEHEKMLMRDNYQHVKDQTDTHEKLVGYHLISMMEGENDDD
eukprot:230977_1